MRYKLGNTMNKKILILPLTICLLLTTGCNKKKNGNKKGDVVNDAVLKANTDEIRKSIFSSYNLSSKSLPINNITNISYDNGFLVIIDNAESTHFYSVLSETVVGTYSGSFTYQTYASSVAGSFLRVLKDGKTTVFDGLGNKLVNESSQSYTSASITSGLNTSGSYFADIRFDTYRQYFTYDSEGTPKLHASSEGEDYNPGSSVPGIDYESLDNYGHVGYQKIKNSSRYIIFDNKGNEIASFSDPNADAEFFVGDYMIYQNSVKLDNNNNNYDYLNEAGERFSLETYRINYLTAKKESIEVKYVLGVNPNDIHPFFSEKRVYSYAYANLKTISDKKLLNNTTETYIIDSAGALHDNVTGIDLGEFERFGKNYYNRSSKTIYDGNLNELSILANMNPVKCDNGDIIICEVEGKFGAVNPEGKVVIPFVLQNVYTNYVSDNKLLAVYDGKLSLVKFNSAACTHQIYKVYEGIDTVSYLLEDEGAGIGAGLFKVSGPSTSGQIYPNYLSLANEAEENLYLDNAATMSTYVSSSNVTNLCRFVVLERVGNLLSSYRSSPISISR